MLTLKQNVEVPFLRWPKNILCMWHELILTLKSLTWACSTCGFNWAETDLDNLTFSSRHFYIGSILEVVPMERHKVKRLTQSTAVIKPDYDLRISRAFGSILLLTWDQTSDLWESSLDHRSLAHRWVNATQRCIKHTNNYTHRPTLFNIKLFGPELQYICIINESTIMSTSSSCVETFLKVFN